MKYVAVSDSQAARGRTGRADENVLSKKIHTGLGQPADETNISELWYIEKRGIVTLPSNTDATAFK